MKDPLVTSFDAIDNLYLKEKLEGEEHSGAHGENSVSLYFIENLAISFTCFV